MIHLPARGTAFRQAAPKAGQKVSPAFSKAAGVRGQSPRGLALDRKGGAPQQKDWRGTSDGPKASERRTRSAAKDASRANLLTWEIEDFSSHREMQTGCRSVAALNLTERCHYLRERDKLGALRAQRPIVQSALSAKLRNVPFPSLAESAARLLWRRGRVRFANSRATNGLGLAAGRAASEAAWCAPP